MSTLAPFGGPVIVRDIDPASGDDADWTLASAIPAAALFTHPGGPIHLTFDTVDSNGNPVAPGSADFDFELRQIVGGSVFAGVPVVGAVPLQRYAEGQTPDGGYAVRVINKANMPAGASFLRVRAQAGDGTSQLAIRTGTIAQLQALTSAQVSVGDVAWSATHQRLVYALTATAGGSTWAYEEIETYAMEASWTGDANIRYMPFVDSTAGTVITTGRVSLALPYSGRVLRSTLNQNSGTLLGAVDVTTHISADGSAPSTTPTETEAITVAALDTTYTSNFDGSPFVADGRLVIGVNPAADPVGGFIMLTLVLAYTVPAV